MRRLYGGRVGARRLWVLVAVAGLVASLLVTAAIVAPVGVESASAQAQPPTGVRGSNHWQRAQKMCGGSVTLSTDDWLNGEASSVGHSLYGYAYFPEGVTTVTTSKTVRAVTDWSFSYGDLQVKLYYADSPPDGSFVTDVSKINPEVPRHNDGSPFSAQETTQVNLAVAGWYRVQVNADYRIGYLHTGYEVNLTFGTSTPCTRELLEMACVCNPGSGALAEGAAKMANPVSTGYGNKLESFSDLEVPARGGGLAVGRSYNSLLAGVESPLGWGWTWGFGAHLEFDIPNAGDVRVVQGSGAPVVFSPTVVSGGSIQPYAGPPWASASLVRNSDGTFVFTLKDGSSQVFGSRTDSNVAARGRLVSLKNIDGYQTSLGYGANDKLATVTDDASGRKLTFGWNTAFTRVVSVTDEASPPRTVTYGYDGAGDLRSVIDVEGNTMAFEYAAHRLTHKRYPKQANPDPDDTTHDVVSDYDGAGRVIKQTDNRVSPARETTFDYAAAGLPAQDANDPNGATKITVGPAGSAPSYTRVDFYTHGQRTRVEEGVGGDLVTRRFTYDPATGGMAKSEVLAVAPSTWKTEAEFTFDADGNRLTATDGVGNRWVFTYNDRGEPLTVTDPARVVTTNVYDDHGHLSSTCVPVADAGPPAGSTASCGQGGADALTTLGYDAIHPGDLVWVRDPDHQDAGHADAKYTTRYTYNPGTGYPETVTAPETPDARAGGNKTTYAFDSVGRLLSVTAPPRQDANANLVEYKTDVLASNKYGDVLEVRDPAGNVTKRHFDVNHNLDWSQPADGNCTAVPAVKCTTYSYDLGDRLLATNRPEAGTALVNEYWADGSLKVQNDAGVITTYGYDSAGRLRTVTAPKPAATDPDRVTTYGYDAFGRVRFRQDPTGSCTATPRVACVEYGYDDASRPATVTYSDPGTLDVTGIGYDALGRKLSVTTSDTAVSAYTWDTAGRMRSSTENGQTTGYGWSLAGDNISIAYPGGSCAPGTPSPTKCVTYSYDDAHRMASVTDWNGRVTAFGSDVHGNPDKITYPGATPAAVTVDDFDFDAADRLSLITYKKNNTSFASETYGRTAAGLVSSDIQTGMAAPSGGNTRAFGYDGNNQLCFSAATGAGAACGAAPSGAQTWTYSAAGAMTKTASGLYMRSDAAGQLCYSNDVFGDASAACGVQNPATATSYQYDVRGNRTGATPPAFESLPSSYSYDQQNRMTQATVPAGAWNDGEFNTLGTPARIADTHPGSPTCPGGVCAKVAAGATIEVPVGGVGGIPATGVSAVAVDLAVTGGTGSGFLTVYSSDLTTVPGTSNLNYGPGQAVSNGAVVKVGANNKIKITNTSSGAVDVTVDASGWYSAYNGAAGGTFNAIDPARLTTTAVTVPANGSTDVTVAGVGGIPASGVAAVTTNLTVTGVTAPGDLVAYSTGLVAPPATTNVAFVANQTVASAAIVKVGGDGKIRLFNRSAQPVSVYVDAFGWTAVTASTAQADYVSTTPTRVTTQHINAGETITVAITGTAAVPATATVTAVSATITASGSSGTGLLTAWPTGLASAPGTDSLVYTAAGPVANGVIVKVGPDGKINLTATWAATDVTVDVTGYYQPAARTTSYTYNADGSRKTRTTTGGATTQFHWSHHQGLPLLLTETLVGYGSLNTIYGPGGLPVEQVQDSGADPLFLHHDQIGSTRLATDLNGAVVGTWTYDPYGALIAVSGNYLATRFLYTGQYNDWETGLYNLRARLYDPATGQFLSRDPLANVTRDGYGYGSGDPLDHIDPSGLDDASCLAAASSGRYASEDCTNTGGSSYPMNLSPGGYSEVSGRAESPGTGRMPQGFVPTQREVPLVPGRVTPPFLQITGCIILCFSIGVAGREKGKEGISYLTIGPFGLRGLSVDIGGVNPCKVEGLGFGGSAGLGVGANASTAGGGVSFAAGPIASFGPTVTYLLTGSNCGC